MLIPALSLALQTAGPVAQEAEVVVPAESVAVQTQSVQTQIGQTQTVPAAVPAGVLPAPAQAPVTAPAEGVPPAQTAADSPAAKDTRPQNTGIVVTGQAGPPPSDPAQAVNEQSYAVVQAVDDAVVAPVAKAYKKSLPSPIRTGIRNALSNLLEPIYFINFLLQGKPGKAVETFGRFALNTTLGVAGLVDVAKTEPFKLPRRVNGFANTMGYYGIGSGPYMFLPVVGPTTLRDVLGLGLDRGLLPLALGSPFTSPGYVVSVGVVKSLDDRVEFDCELTQQKQSSNPYNTTREFYLERRKAEIEALHGREYKPKGQSLFDITQQCQKTSAQVVPKQEDEDVSSEPSPEVAAPLTSEVPAEPQAEPAPQTEPAPTSVPAEVAAPAPVATPEATPAP